MGCCNGRQLLGVLRPAVGPVTENCYAARLVIVYADAEKDIVDLVGDLVRSRRSKGQIKDIGR